jgi:integrase
MFRFHTPLVEPGMQFARTFCVRVKGAKCALQINVTPGAQAHVDQQGYRPKHHINNSQMDALLGVPDKQTSQRRCDYALLQFLYNSGVCAQGAGQLLISELAGCSVKIRGKGGKERHCPLWPSTVEELRELIEDRPPDCICLCEPMRASHHTLRDPCSCQTLFPQAPG